MCVYGWVGGKPPAITQMWKFISKNMSMITKTKVKIETQTCFLCLFWLKSKWNLFRISHEKEKYMKLAEYEAETICNLEKENFKLSDLLSQAERNLSREKEKCRVLENKHSVSHMQICKSKVCKRSEKEVTIDLSRIFLM